MQGEDAAWPLLRMGAAVDAFASQLLYRLRDMVAGRRTSSRWAGWRETLARGAPTATGFLARDKRQAISSQTVASANVIRSICGASDETTGQTWV